MVAHVQRVELTRGVTAQRQGEYLVAAELPSHVLRRLPFSYAEPLSHDLPEGPVRDSVAVREAAARPDRRAGLLGTEHVLQLTDEARLPDPRLADDRHGVRLRAGRRPPIRRAEKLELALPADEHAAETADATRPRQAKGAQHGHTDDTLRFPLRLDRGRLTKLERPG